MPKPAENPIHLSRHCYLIGYRGSGKSAVAAALANIIGCPLLDTDAMVVKKSQLTIREIFSSQGEEKFRDLESAAIDSTVSLAPHIISLGGGAILRSSNRVTIKENGVVCWLTASPKTLWQRISSDGKSHDNRPALTELPERKELTRLLNERTPLYESAADLIIDTTHLAVDSVAEKLILKLQSVE